MKRRFRATDALVLIDVQNDFCPGGTLAVLDGDAIVPELNQWIAAAVRDAAPIVASRDWHPREHASFTPHGGIWPPHCIQRTKGARFHSDLALPQTAIVVSKGTELDRDAYSAFDGTDIQGTALADTLRAHGITHLYAGGLATDFCVKATVLDALNAGFAVTVIVPAVRAVNLKPKDGARALGAMQRAGALLLGAQEATR